MDGVITIHSDTSQHLLLKGVDDAKVSMGLKRVGGLEEGGLRTVCAYKVHDMC